VLASALYLRLRALLRGTIPLYVCVCAIYAEPIHKHESAHANSRLLMLGLGQLTADWPANISAPPSHSRCIWTQHQFVVWILHVDLVLLKHIREQQTDLVVSMPRGGKAYTACFEHSNLLANEIGSRGASQLRTSFGRTACCFCTSEPRTSFGRPWCLCTSEPRTSFGRPWG
jgi:hypothetical protein